jgi:hypothetical protein
MGGLVRHQVAQFVALGLGQATFKLACNEVIEPLLGRLDVQLGQRAQEVGAALFEVDEQVQRRELVQRVRFLAAGKVFEQGPGRQRGALAAEPDQFDQ